MKLQELLNYKNGNGEEMCHLRAELSTRPRSWAEIRRSLCAMLFDYLIH